MLVNRTTVNQRGTAVRGFAPTAVRGLRWWCDRLGSAVTATVVAPTRGEEAYRALRVPFRTRQALRWYARADRRAGLPVGLALESTPAFQQLRAQFDDVAERERTR